MKRNGLIWVLVALLVLPVMSMALTSCGGKEVVEEQPPAGPTPEEIARQEYLQMKDVFVNEYVYFDFDKYNIRPDMESVMQYKGDFMTKYGNVVVEVQGHCDERGTEAYNMALGDRRANSCRNWLEAAGIMASRLTTVSYGEERPIDMGHDEAAWAKNRRAEFVVISE